MLDSLLETGAIAAASVPSTQKSRKKAHGLRAKLLEHTDQGKLNELRAAAVARCAAAAARVRERRQRARTRRGEWGLRGGRGADGDSPARVAVAVAVAVLQGGDDVGVAVRPGGRGELHGGHARGGGGRRAGSKKPPCLKSLLASRARGPS